MNFMNKPLGGRTTQFRVKGLGVAHGCATHGDHVIVIRTCLLWPNLSHCYVFGVSHFHRLRHVQSICQREGHFGKTALVEAIRSAVLACEADPAIKAAVEQLRASAIQQVEAFSAPPTELEKLERDMIGCLPQSQFHSPAPQNPPPRST